MPNTDELHFDTRDIGQFDASQVRAAKEKTHTRITKLHQFTIEGAATAAEAASARTKIINLRKHLAELEESEKRKPAETRLMDLLEVRERLKQQQPTYERDWDLSDAPPLRRPFRIPSWIYYTGAVAASWALCIMAVMN